MTLAFGWLFGASLILIGFWLTGFYFLTGLALALAGFLWWPPSRQWLIPRVLPPMLLLHVGLTLCLLVIALFAFIGRQTLLLEEAGRLEAERPALEAQPAAGSSSDGGSHESH